MDPGSEFLRIVRDTVLEMAQVMAQINLESCDEAMTSGCRFTVSTSGAYLLTLMFYIDAQLMRAIAERMSRGCVENATDIAMYNQEFFNILCGNIISQINRQFKSSARFGIPALENPTSPPEGFPIEASWRSGEGRMGVFCMFDRGEPCVTE